MVDRDKFESKVDYRTVLDNFEGPLDLLLFLINKEEIEIKDIFVSQVTEQFLLYMQGLPYIDVEKVGEYLNIAATILKIKANSLVPAVEDEGPVEEDEDKAELIRALEEYKLIKEEAAKLKELETVGYFFKEPDSGVGETKTVYTLEGLTLEGLVSAFSKLLLKRDQELTKIDTREIPRDLFTVGQKAAFILEALEEGGEIAFTALFAEDCTKPEIVTTFQALLELLKHQRLLARQEEAFGEIYISRNPDAKEDDALGEFDEYN